MCGGKITMKVNMGEPGLLYTDNGEDMFRPIADIPIEVNGEKMLYTPVNIKGDHAVFFVEDIENMDINDIGQKITSNKNFVSRNINVEFVKIINIHNIFLRSWDSQVGEFCASGSGACASVVAGILTGKIVPEVNVHQKGGVIKVEWPRREKVFATMENSSDFVFTSEHLNQ